MQTVTIELLNEDAISLLEELEKLNILKLVSKRKKTARKWAGSLSQKTTDKMLNELSKSRKEWNRDI